MVHARTFPKPDDGYFMIESIHDPIEVITMFGNGKMRPIRFRWKNKIVKVAKVTGDWVRHEGQNKKYTLELYAQAYNALDHLNAINYSGVVTSPFFGLATSAAPPRRIEIGSRLTF